MKISKLFHWLYAGVMLLPMFAIGVTCGYAMLNKNAKDSYSGANGYQIKYKYETNDVESIDDLKLGNIYKFNISQITNASSGTYFTSKFIVFHRYQYTTMTCDTNTYFAINYTGANFQMIIYDNNNIQQNTYALGNEDISFTYLSNTTLAQDYINYITSSDYNEIDDVDITNEGTLDNVFYYAVDKVTESPLFSWSYNSFLVAPFSYIVALFGMPTNHVVVELLSYWLAISIIWLVFDLVMYVPLLVHRWLDKGVLE